MLLLVAETMDIEHIIHTYYLRKIFGKELYKQNKASELEQCPKGKGR